MTSQLSAAMLWSVVLGSFLLSALAIIMTMLRRQRPALPVPAVASPLRETERLTAAEDALMQWSPEMLRQVLQTELPDGDLIVVDRRSLLRNSAGPGHGWRDD